MYQSVAHDGSQHFGYQNSSEWLGCKELELGDDEAVEVKAQSTPALRGSEPSAPLAVPSAQESELPGEVKVPSSESIGEWLSATDQATGNTYYWNTVTREVTWELPERD